MVCDKNGVGADFGHGHVYAGDRWRCKICGAMVLKTNENAFHDPNYTAKDEYLRMDTLPLILSPNERTPQP
jgi:hypothetical protein